MKSYEDFLDAVENLDFIEDTDTADAAVKAVLGIMASRVDEKTARKLTDNLPAPLTFEKLRGHQVRPVQLSVRDYVAEIASEFNLTQDQARILIDTVLRTTKEHIGEEVVRQVEVGMPFRWAVFVEGV